MPSDNAAPPVQPSAEPGHCTCPKDSHTVGIWTARYRLPECAVHGDCTEPDRCIRCGGDFESTGGKPVDGSGVCQKCRSDEAYSDAAVQSLDAPQDDGWVTFGRVKVDIENETETFERIHPPQPSTTTTGEGARRIVAEFAALVREDGFQGGPYQAVESLMDERDADEDDHAVDNLLHHLGPIISRHFPPTEATQEAAREVLDLIRYRNEGSGSSIRLPLPEQIAAILTKCCSADAGELARLRAETRKIIQRCAHRQNALAEEIKRLDAVLSTVRADAIRAAMEIANTCLQEHNHTAHGDVDATNPAACIYFALESLTKKAGDDGPKVEQGDGLKDPWWNEPNTTKEENGR